MDPDDATADGAVTTPDQEAQYAFSTQQQADQGARQAQAAFDTTRARRAFVSGVLGGAEKARSATRQNSLASNLT